ncbi:MAG: class I SAM-dependent methyltransferase [Actinomycetota bacterium]
MAARVPPVVVHDETGAHIAPEPSLTAPRFLWPSYPPSGYLGQLDDGYQATLRSERSYITRADCDFYHTSELRDGTVARGPWDLRGHEAEYLGGVEVGGLRVLELGPATGHLSFWMEQQNADVVAFDVGYDRMIDLMVYGREDHRALKMDHVGLIGGVQNSWWYLHRDKESRVRKVYGNIYDLPGDLGTFDMSIFCAILLHLRDPFTALEQAARRTRDAIVVTEAVDHKMASDVDAMRFDPSDQPDNRTVWWSFNPLTIEKMLRRLGFARTTVIYHVQKHHFGHDMDAPAGDYPMFTVVGRP